AIESADLDLPDRPEPGLEPAALVASSVPIASGGARGARREPRRAARQSPPRDARSGPAAERDGGPRLAGVVRTAVRPARGDCAARDRWAQLRGARRGARHCGRNGQVDARARTGQRARSAEGIVRERGIDIMTLGCDAYGHDLGPFVDGELDGGRMLRLTRHLEECDACAAALEEVQQLGRILRESSPVDARPGRFDGFAAGVVARSVAERSMSWRATWERAIDGWHWVIV